MRFRIAPLSAASLLALGGFNALLLAVVIADHTPEEQTAAANTEWTPNLPPSGTQPLNLKPINGYSQTLSRPILFKTREPYVPPPPPPPPAPKPVAAAPPVVVDPGLVLGGVMITNDARKAYLFNKADARGMWLSEGDTTMGWMLESIDSMSAKLRQAGRTIELHLYPHR